jgi:mRNA interferase MazF
MNQFDVYSVDFNPTKGSEIRKKRSAVIISPNQMNVHLKTVIVAPLTHTVKGYPSRVLTKFGDDPGEIVLDQIRAVDKIRLTKKLGKIDKSTATHIKLVLATMFS